MSDGGATGAAVAASPRNSRLDDRAKKKIVTGGSALGAVAMSSCCIVPLVLFSLGISGAWIGNLTALYPYKLYFFAVTAAFLAAGFYWTYRTPKAAACEPGGYCGTTAADRVMKAVLWSSTALVAAALAFPYAVPLLL
jgi:mercuric ion transport protein